MTAKTASEIIDFLQPDRVIGQIPDRSIVILSSDSREVMDSGMFIAIRGLTVDGHNYISSAIDHGAKIIMIEHDLDHYDPDILYLLVSDTTEELSRLCGFFYDYPDRDLTLIGITGTNGKTSTAHYIFQLFTYLGEKCGLISTTEILLGPNQRQQSDKTTPDIISLYKTLDKMRDNACNYVVMEVSSHAIDQKRIGALYFEQALFTNITHDHLDYHETFDAYIKAKKKFFDDLAPSSLAIVNKDDPRGEVMIQNTKAHKKTYALNSLADYHCRIVDKSDHFQQIRIDGQEVYIPLIGRFNVYNILAAIGSVVESGFDMREVLEKASLVQPVAGRMQLIISESSSVRGVVDYSHTPDSLKNALLTLREQLNADQRIICVIGCGGDRDRTKRPKMAQIAYQNSDQAIFTSDNPRSEDPKTILDEMMIGLDEESARDVLVIENRKEAIKMACKLARGYDFILVAGKGHENYQEIKGVKYPFDDAEVLKDYMT